MSRDDENAVLALKNAWLGVTHTAQEVATLQTAVDGLPETTDPATLDFATYHRVVGAHANAVMALHGLLDELKRKAESED